MPNAIQTYNKINFYIDLTRGARFRFSEVDMAVNDSIEKFVAEKIGDPKHRTPESVQWIQQDRDAIYTLRRTASPTLSAGTNITTPYYTTGVSTFPIPADYYAFLSLSSIISSKTIYAKPTDDNALGPLLEDSFRHPSDTKIYFNDGATGTANITIYRGSTTPASVLLTYLKTPNTFTMGSETQLISYAGSPLALATGSYYATEVSTFNSVVYQIGDTITGNGALTLTAGQVILQSATQPIPLPDSTHEEIAIMAAIRLGAVVTDVQRMQTLTAEFKSI